MIALHGAEEAGMVFVAGAQLLLSNKGCERMLDSLLLETFQSLFQIGSCSVSQAGLKCVILLPQP